MPRKAPKSLADHYRAHRAAMELALELNITPACAAKIIESRAAAAKSREAEQRLQAKINGQSPPTFRGEGWEGGLSTSANPTPKQQPWMLRD